MTTKRSPGGPPRTPCSPSPARRSRDPSSTPAGIWICSECSFSLRPEPAQSVQGSAIVLPLPLQLGQVRATVKKPWLTRTCPRPPHVLHGTGGDPSALPEPVQVAQVSSRGIRSVGSAPNAASSNVRERSYRRSAPGTGPTRLRRRRLPKPKRSPRMSEKSPKVSGSKPPNPPAPPREWPKRS